MTRVTIDIDPTEWQALQSHFESEANARYAVREGTVAGQLMAKLYLAMVETGAVNETELTPGYSELKTEIIRQVQVSLDEDVYERVRELAEPLVDDVNSVLRRELGIDQGPSSGRARRGSLLPQIEYELPILTTLVTLGGSAPAGKVMNEVRVLLEERFTLVDLDTTTSGKVRWQTQCQRARLHLKKRGELAANSPYATWEITEKGRQRVTTDAKPERPRPAPVTAFGQHICTPGRDDPLDRS